MTASLFYYYNCSTVEKKEARIRSFLLLFGIELLPNSASFNFGREYICFKPAETIDIGNNNYKSKAALGWSWSYIVTVGFRTLYLYSLIQTAVTYEHTVLEF
jgi:hypothetical protein